MYSPSPTQELSFTKITERAELPDWLPRATLETFFHETMKPYHDTLLDVRRALDYALVDGCGQGGFLMVAHREQVLEGALLMLHTGMGGYVPENLLVFVSVQPEARGHGIGRQLIERSLRECSGAVKLHVEYDNPAKRLYERVGFSSKYAEMRFEEASS